LISYLETSFLVSLYTPDANSEAAATYITKAGGPFPLTRFGEVELTNAIELRIFRKEVTTHQGEATLARIASHIATGIFYACRCRPQFMTRRK
jgi:hypothetical protein